MMRRIAACVLLVTAFALGSASAKTAPKPAPQPATVDPAILRAMDPSPETDADLNWSVTLAVFNPGGTGLYLDSLWVDIDDLSPGETRADRHSTANLTGLVKFVGSLSPGDSTQIQHGGPAVAEHARLTYHLRAHRAAGTPITLETVVEVRPGASARVYPSEFLDVAGRKVEIVRVPATVDTGRTPGILLVHGHGSNARHSLRAARMFAQRGYSVMLVSMPGYGDSQGPADFMGPASVAAAAAALDRLAHDPGVDPNRLFAVGISRGATVVALLATSRKDVKAIVLQSGIYDLWATYRGTTLPGFRETIVAEAGSDSAAWRARSPLGLADRITVPALVLHGEKDTNVPAGQAHAFFAVLASRNKASESRFYPNSEHQLPTGETFRLEIEFIRKQQPAR